MKTPLLDLEGTWDEITANAPDFRGLRVHVIVLPAEGDDAVLPDVQVDEHDSLGALIEASRVDTGIPDLAHEHDHYVHGKQKRGA